MRNNLESLRFIKFASLALGMLFLLKTSVAIWQDVSLVDNFINYVYASFFLIIFVGIDLPK